MKISIIKNCLFFLFFPILIFELWIQSRFRINANWISYMALNRKFQFTDLRRGKKKSSKLLLLHFIAIRLDTFNVCDGIKDSIPSTTKILFGDELMRWKIKRTCFFHHWMKEFHSNFNVPNEWQKKGRIKKNFYWWISKTSMKGSTVDSTTTARQKQYKKPLPHFFSLCNGTWSKSMKFMQSICFLAMTQGLKRFLNNSIKKNL